VYTKEDLRRGRFTYFGQKKKNKLYELGKKNFNSYAKPRANWNGTFTDFNPFGEEYGKIKRKSLQEALNPQKKALEPKKVAQITRGEVLRQLNEHLPIKNKGELAKAMDFSRKTLWNYLNAKEIPKIEV
tara:strand:+ start:55 stop:441 length:387 start_codon:yes stop_codon:yes gene_type:complete